MTPPPKVTDVRAAGGGPAKRWCGGRVTVRAGGGRDDQAFEVPLVGSSASRRASPIRETEVSSAIRNPAGKRNSQGRETTAGVPSCSRVPSETSGGWMPRPKYDSEVSAMIAPHTPMVASTISSEDTLGTM